MQKLIIALREHTKFGFIFSAFISEQKNEHYISIIQNISLEDAKAFPELINEEIKPILKTIDSYSDKQIFRIFSNKHKNINDFLKKISKQDIEKRIRPFIEKRLITVIKNVSKTDIILYLKKEKFPNLYKEDIITIKKEVAKTVFNIERENAGTKYFLSIKHNNNLINLYKKSGIIISNEPCRLLLEKNIYLFDDIDGKKLKPFFAKTFINVPKATEKKWFEAFGIKAIKKYEVNPKGFSIVEKKVACKPELVLEKDWKNEYSFILYFNYGKDRFQSNKAPIVNLEFDENKFEFFKFTRDIETEAKIINNIQKIGLKLQADNSFKISKNIKNFEQQKFETIKQLNKLVEKLKKINVNFKQDIYNKKYFTQKISADIKITKGKDWFDIYGTVQFGEFEIPFLKLKNNIINNKKEFILPDKTIAIIPDEWFAKYSDIFMFAKDKDDGLRIKKIHFEALQKTELKGIDDDFRENIEKLLTFKDFDVQLPKNIKADFRDYQKDGYKWMYFLQKNNFGGCLADDMGLGKTLQTIAVLQQTINSRKETSNTLKNKIPKANTQLSLFGEQEESTELSNYEQKASLVVMPVSLIHNWKNELKKFAPNLKILQYKGRNRQKYISDFDNYDVILSGYATIRNDIELIKEYDFIYIILDESQYIKNSTSKTYKAIMNLGSEHKLVLTGTPIENSLSDLWSQMNFINEGMLGNKGFFFEKFIKPIEVENDEIQAKKLKRLIGPFMLRRTKNEVAKDLPPLSEQTIYCQQDEKQKSIYEETKSKIRNKIIENIENGKKQNLPLEILSALSKLRQISNHPVLVNKKYEGESGKFNEIIRNLESLISENHKVLIFSSFVKHLNLFASYFEKNNIKYSKLTGQTKNREEVISEFQNNNDNHVFLISIKSGGTGLNLTEADYVFIIDPWWNPAIEKQAVNRAHRIGQNKKVMVYRYITENSVEEKIAKLQEKKSQLADAFINSNNPLKNMKDDDIVRLFD